MAKDIIKKLRMELIISVQIWVMMQSPENRYRNIKVDLKQKKKRKKLILNYCLLPWKDK